MRLFRVFWKKGTWHISLPRNWKQRAEGEEGEWQLATQSYFRPSEAWQNIFRKILPLPNIRFLFRKSSYLLQDQRFRTKNRRTRKFSFQKREALLFLRIHEPVIFSSLLRLTVLGDSGNVLQILETLKGNVWSKWAHLHFLNKGSYYLARISFPWNFVIKSFQLYPIWDVEFPEFKSNFVNGRIGKCQCGYRNVVFFSETFGIFGILNNVLLISILLRMRANSLVRSS